jgi:hypothetical protein
LPKLSLSTASGEYWTLVSAWRCRSGNRGNHITLACLAPNSSDFLGSYNSLDHDVTDDALPSQSEAFGSRVTTDSRLIARMPNMFRPTIADPERARYGRIIIVLNSYLLFVSHFLRGDSGEMYGPRFNSARWI